MKLIAFFTTAILTRCIATDSCSKQGDCPDEYSIVGKWKNELGSTLEIKSCQNGQIDGFYNTAAGKASDEYVLTGRYTFSDPNTAELGWVVSWNNMEYGNSNSATSWNGIYYAEENKIYTQWILTSYVERENLWSSSMINHDEFTRVD